MSFATRLRAILPKLTRKPQLRTYEAASKSFRLKNWGLTDRLPLEADAKTLRKRARHLVNNNPYAHRAVQTMASYVVGGGITPHATQANGKKSARHETLLKAWADTTLCDFYRRHTLYGLQALALKHLFRDGEVFIQKIIDKKHKPLPLRLKLLEAEYLDESKNDSSGERQTINGIEFNTRGERLAYWIYDRHPDLPKAKAAQSRRIQASEIIHLYRPERAGQERGVSWLAPIMVRLKDFDDYEDAELLRQKIAACFVGFYRDLEAQGDDFEEKNAFPSEMTPGSILKAPAGQTIEFSNPPSSEGYQGYAEHTKMTIAIGCGVPYMLLSGDYSKVNYSSARMAQLNFMRHIEQVQRHLLIPQMCDPIFNWFADSCELIGVQGVVHAKWVPPKKDLVDQMKEFEAYKTAVDAGFMSHAQVVRELGEDPEDVYRDIETTKKYLHDKGLSFEQ